MRAHRVQQDQLKQVCASLFGWSVEVFENAPDTNDDAWTKKLGVTKFTPRIALRRMEKVLNDGFERMVGIRKNHVGGAPFGFRREGREIVEEPWRARVVADIMTLHKRGVSIRATISQLSVKHGVPLSFSAVQRTIQREKAE